MPRSGLALRHGISLVNTPGIIDAAYRGELKCVLLNTDPTADYEVSRGDRIAQLIIQRVEEVEWVEVDDVSELDGIDRGGFGHTAASSGRSYGLTRMSPKERHGSPRSGRSRARGCG